MNKDFFNSGKKWKLKKNQNKIPELKTQWPKFKIHKINVPNVITGKRVDLKQISRNDQTSERKMMTRH